MVRKPLPVFGFILFALFAVPAAAQITIEECREQARLNYPLVKKLDLIAKASDYTVSNANRRYLPVVTVSGRATYQSEVTEFSTYLPGFESLSKDQYLVTVDVAQVLWDGGRVRAQKKQSRANEEIDILQLEVELYKLNDRVDQLFFGILLLDGQLRQNELYAAELENSYKTITAHVENGIAGSADLDSVRLEQIKSFQDRIQLLSSREAYVLMLETMTGLDLGAGLVTPMVDIPIAFEINRPELKLFDAQVALYESQKSSILADNMPEISLFFSGNYGKPGLDMLNNDFHPYFQGGLKLSWTFSNLYTIGNSKRLIEVNRQSVETDRETFLLNTNLDIKQQFSNLERLMETMKYDDEIIALRRNVRKSAEAKVAGGIMTVADYMREVIEENLAYQNKMLHEIEFLEAVYKFRNTVNN
ncbi:TolC family protein [Brucepastera parasyntrophica]|uniref:TolC family protein n=1 Tax=Brucepastera parasyntrophica TaxID=2880008 RepID=UPI0021093EAB|nr:TolC family protein [Brucepastera parasyntrophica]ULQ58510.1 TolC family protein [Brucepastera parasyntrophica]